jgi:ribosome-interacting GTPase 1
MTANLSPEFKAADEEFRKAKDPQAKLACLEKMLSTIPKHKGTEKMQADLKRKIAKLKEGLEKKSGPKGFSVSVERAGAAQVALIGAANAGKSTLVEMTTNAKTEVADYPFSTRTVVPAMLLFENLQFQLLDLPAVSAEYMEPWVSDIIRNADCAFWLVDAGSPTIADQVEEVRNQLLQKKIELVGQSAALSKRDEPIRRIRSLVLGTKMDNPQAKAGLEYLKECFEPDIQVLPVSALADDDLSGLGKVIFDLNRIIRVFAKTPGKRTDLSKPYALHQGDCLLDFARVIHKDFANNLRYAKVWGSGKFDGQRIQRDQELTDGDIIELHM